MSDAHPWGLIIFKRNVEKPEHLKRLVSAFVTLSGMTRRFGSIRKADACNGSVRRTGRLTLPAQPMGG